MWIFVVGVVLGVVFMIHADIVPGTDQKSIHLNMENLPLRILFIPTTVSIILWNDWIYVVLNNYPFSI